MIAAPSIDLGRLSLGSFRDQPVAVLGLARSGTALARFLSGQGARVTVYDARPRGELGAAVAAIEEVPGPRARLLLGPEVDPAEALAGQALVCTSPSISSRFPTTEPRLRRALALLEEEGRVPIVSEIDLFLRLCPSATVGVTGTKGKTTTSALCAAILGRDPAPVLLGGNIGSPLVERLPELTASHRVVLELSELQLPTLSRGTHVAVYTHVTADHLDRHGTLEAYRNVKRRLLELLRPGGALVRNDEDPVVGAYRVATDVQVVAYRRAAPPAGGVGLVDGWIVADEVGRLAGSGGGIATTHPGGRVMSTDAIALPGRHSLSNVLAAVAVGLLHGVDPDAIADAVARFPGVEHRLQVVAMAGGVRYVDDSQGTQPDAVQAAIASFPRPLVLICGGRSKGLPLDRLARTAAERVSAAVLIGETAAELERAFRGAGLGHTERASDMPDAVERADRLARHLLGAAHASEEAQADVTATVLLSPAAASFDMFTDYAARGEAFTSAVRALLDRRAVADASRDAD